MRLHKRDQRFNLVLSKEEKRLLEAIADLEDLTMSSVIVAVLRKYAKDAYDLGVLDFSDANLDRHGLSDDTVVTAAEHLARIDKINTLYQKEKKRNKHLVDLLEQCKPFVNFPITYRTYD